MNVDGKKMTYIESGIIWEWVCHTSNGGAAAVGQTKGLSRVVNSKLCHLGKFWLWFMVGS